MSLQVYDLNKNDWSLKNAMKFTGFRQGVDTNYITWVIFLIIVKV